MIRGLLWLPLLMLFIWLAWAGWNEYQKLEAYRQWAEKFDQAKYDIYAVLGIQGDRLTWGKPTRRGPIDLKSFSLANVTDIRVLTDGGDRAGKPTNPVDPQNPPTQARQIALEFQLTDDSPILVPFTELPLALRWADYLQKQLQNAKSEQ
jgi:hypothetical protein